ncbi:protein RKD5 isoform X1 [Vigna radiata var. radiata]|uniref:Protein RKD5 isoform X1 n=1 Tax=Vigna radiata var. radiata TaxID=3916 RepID=A0A1S3VPK5_VIGRR|nr:protein RKD5 isoform X1 [Vigna radiata var. radiata]
MDSTLLTNLLLFNNTVQPELMRSLHVYRQGDEEERAVEREFVFSECGSYVEMQATPILKFVKSHVSRVFQGYKNGVWLCIFAYHADHTPRFYRIPPLLLVSRNPKLQMVPNLLHDLHVIYKLDRKEEDKDTTLESKGEECQGNSDNFQPSEKVFPVLDQDLNYLPYEEDESELLENETDVESSPGLLGKKKRAPSDLVAKISLSDLVQYFGMPIVEASRNLNVGLTVLKRKCREFGIPRWPHRKIKSLDSLIHDLQEEAKSQELEDMEAAMAVAKRQRMLECEKENIEKKPFMDIQTETKRFRQDVFKRRHRARAVGKHNSTVSNT